MMNRTLLRVLVVIAVLAMTFTVAATGGNPFRNETSTAAGYSTWDADLINIENVAQTGKGVYVAVLDTGLMPNWQDYFPKARIATELGKGFEQPISFKAHKDNCGYGVELGALHETSWVGSIGSTHGTHVASTILGYFYRSNNDAAAGYPLPPIMVRGIAPEVTIIPVKVMADYELPALPKCPEPSPAQKITIGTSSMLVAGIRYVGDLAAAGYRPMVINMSLNEEPGVEITPVEQEAIDYAISQGVIVVASAGNHGELGMGAPGSYGRVISVGAAGWTYEWYHPGPVAPDPPSIPRYRMWWLQNPTYDYVDIPDPISVADVYVPNFSSRALGDQDLDVLAPGSWVRGPLGGDPGYNHLPWWSKGIGDQASRNGGNFYNMGGTSMAVPHVAAVAAMMLQKNPSLTQEQVESILESTALPITMGPAEVFDINPTEGWYTYSWEANAVGAGLLQADAAVAAVP